MRGRMSEKFVRARVPRGIARAILARAEAEGLRTVATWQRSYWVRAARDDCPPPLVLPVGPGDEEEEDEEIEMRLPSEVFEGLRARAKAEGFRSLGAWLRSYWVRQVRH